MPIIYISKAVKAYIELESIKHIDTLKDAQLRSKDKIIVWYAHGLDDCLKSNDTLTQTTIPALKQENNDFKALYSVKKKELKQSVNKGVIASVIGSIAGIGIGILTGFLIHK